VGLGYSPNVQPSGKDNNNLSRSIRSFDDSELHPFSSVQNFQPFSEPTNVSLVKEKTKSAESEDDASFYFLEFTIIRASEITECLGGTNSYVLLKCSSLDRSFMTSTVLNTINPYYGTAMKIKLPVPSHSTVNEESKTNLQLSKFLEENNIQLILLNKNLSLSDEIIGTLEVNLLSLLQMQKQQQSVNLHFKDSGGCPAGLLEIQIKLLLMR
jgi:hypothetical protein